jgi:hypothetical protein
VWDLKNDKIFVSKRLLSRNYTQITKDEEILISYGERANSFLIIEYGFTLPDNRYDFFRMKRVSAEDVRRAAETFGLGGALASPEDTEINLANLKLKDTIRCDLKLSGLHRDLIRLIRCSLKSDPKYPQHAPES